MKLHSFERLNAQQNAVKLFGAKVFLGDKAFLGDYRFDSLGGSSSMEGKIVNASAGSDTEPQGISAVQALGFLVLTFILGLASNLMMVFLHQLGHFIVAAATLGFSSSVMTVGRYFAELPPYIWFAGKVDHLGTIEGPAYFAYNIAPVFTALFPAVIILAVRRLGVLAVIRDLLQPLLRGYVAFWLLQTFYSLVPLVSAAEGLSDGASLLGVVGREIALSNPVGIFMSGWVASALFYAVWWIISSYLAARVLRLSLQGLRFLVLSLSAFALLYLLAVFLPILWSWLHGGGGTTTRVKTTTTT